VRIVTSLAISFAVFAALNGVRVATGLGSPEAGPLLSSVAGWMMFCILTALFFVGVQYIFDITDKSKLKDGFARYNLYATGLFAFWLAVSLIPEAA
jgi:hypothetical protein